LRTLLVGLTGDETSSGEPFDVSERRNDSAAGPVKCSITHKVFRGFLAKCVRRFGKFAYILRQIFASGCGSPFAGIIEIYELPSNKEKVRAQSRAAEDIYNRFFRNVKIVE